MNSYRAREVSVRRWYHQALGDPRNSIVLQPRGLPASLVYSRDVIIRWHGNLGFHHNNDCGTVGEFYDIHFRLHNGETFLRMPAKFKTTTQSAIALALFIDPVKVSNFSIFVNDYLNTRLSV